MVLKPSEVAPLNAIILAEVMDEAGVPAGVFNLVNGDGIEVGATLSAHPDVDMMSFTGSTRAGIEVAKAAAPTVKRVAQELGGKSANIILEDADLQSAVAGPGATPRNAQPDGGSCHQTGSHREPARRRPARGRLVPFGLHLEPILARPKDGASRPPHRATAAGADPAFWWTRTSQTLYASKLEPKRCSASRDQPRSVCPHLHG